MDMGSMIIVVNAEKVTVTGAKTDDKLYRRHVNGLPGSMKVETFRQLQARIPERIIEKAVWGMLPKGRLGRRIKLNLKVCTWACPSDGGQAFSMRLCPDSACFFLWR
jgi:large subunit ribosomal protein L13